jgi:hypothetical protein
MSRVIGEEEHVVVLAELPHDELRAGQQVRAHVAVAVKNMPRIVLMARRLFARRLPGELPPSP